MRIMPVLCAVLLTAIPTLAAAGSVTLYLDGARVESEAVASKGYLELSLPRGVDPGSLRIRPLGGASIARVEVAPVQPGRKVESELARLAERKEAVADRLKALAVREDIFRAAAKSQSGKAPRKTKGNLEPLENIRKGTEFAIAQLEGVYRARRKAEGELKELEARLASLREEGGSVARVRLAGKGGRVAFSYLHPALKWIPSYDFRVDREAEAEVVMHALLPRIEKGTAVAVVPARLAETPAESPLPASAEEPARIASFRFKVENARFSPIPQPSLSFSFRNDSAKRLPPGQATCYRQGEYLGKVDFAGCPPGEARELAFGTLSPSAR